MADELDPRVSRRYRELGGEEPPREVDQAILAAAHRAADRAHAPLVAPAGRHRWYFAFGAAAILVLAVAITVQVEREPDPEALPAASAPAVAERKEGFSGGLREQERDARTESRQYTEQAKSQAKVLADQAPAQEAPRKPARAPAPAAPPPAAIPAKPQAAEVARADRLEARREQAPAAETQSPAGPAASAAAPAPRAKPAPQVLASAATLNPEQFLERIAELRKEGRQDEADKALEEFRRQYPDYRISEEMLKKVERPK